MGFLHQAQGEITAAGKLFSEAVDVYSKILPPDDPDLATSLNNLGFYYSQTGDYSLSEDLYRRSLDIRERKLPKNDPAIADSLNNLAELFKSEEQWDEVVPLLNRALEIRTRSLPPNHPIIAATLQNLAGAIEADPSRGSFREAQKLLEKALEIRRSSQRPDHPEIAGTLSKLATNLFNQGKYREAEKRFREALALRRVSQPANHPDIAATLVGLSLNQIEQGKPQEAEQMLRETIAIRTQVFAPTAEQFAESYRYLGRALLYEGKPKEALETIRKGTDIILSRPQRSEKSVEHLTEHLQILAAADAAPSSNHKLDFDEGFTVGQNAEQSETAKAVAGMAARFATQDERLQKLVGDLQTIEATEAFLERHLTDDLAKPPEERDQSIGPLLDDAEKKRASINGEVKAAFPEYFDLVNASSVTSKDAQKLIKDDEALITIVSGTDRTYVWALTKEGFAWHESAMPKVWLQDTVKKLRETLDTEDLKRNITATSGLFDLGLSYELYSKLLAPVESVFACKTEAHHRAVGTADELAVPGARDKGTKGPTSGTRRSSVVSRCGVDHSRALGDGVAVGDKPQSSPDAAAARSEPEANDWFRQPEAWWLPGERRHPRLSGRCEGQHMVFDCRARHGHSREPSGATWRRRGTQDCRQGPRCLGRRSSCRRRGYGVRG